jgi:hypothetical protein
LARKEKISLSQILKKYSKSLKITRKTLVKEKYVIESKSFYDYTLLSNISSQAQTFKLKYDSILGNPFKLEYHWRTQFKMYRECCVCGVTEEIALYHINNLRSMKKKDKYEAIRSQIKRIQIGVCKKCHHDIIHGKYDSPKKPVVFYNKFLVKF